MSEIITLGIDTGDTAGFLIAGWDAGQRKASWAHAYQCDGHSAQDLLAMLLAACPAGITAVQIEAFDARPKTRGLAGTNPDGIRRQVSDLDRMAGQHGIAVYVRQASDVKQWATDARLSAAGLATVTAAASMSRHARDGARHALFTAVHDCGLPDPLSRRRTGQERRDVPG